MSQNKIFFLNNISVTIIGNLASIFAYVFWFFLGRVSSPNDFGEISLLNATLAILFTPLIIIPPLMTKLVNNFYQGNLNLKIFYNLIYKFFLISSIFFILGLVYSFIKFNLFYLFFILLIIIAGFFQQFFISIFQIKKKYIEFSILNSLVIYLKLFFFLIFYYIFNLNSINSFLFSFLFSILLSLFIAYSFSYKKLNVIVNIQSELKFSILIKNIFYLILSNILIISFLNIDILIISRFYESSTLALYNANILFAKAIFYGSIIIIQVMFPEITSLSNKYQIKKIILLSVLINLMLCFFGILIMIFLGELIVDFTYNGNYKFDIKLFLIMGTSMCLMSISNLLILSNIALDNFKSIFLNLLPFLFFLISTNFYNDDIYKISYCFLFSSLFFIIFNSYTILIKIK